MKVLGEMESKFEGMMFRLPSAKFPAFVFETFISELQLPFIRDGNLCMFFIVCLYLLQWRPNY
jgi:hypothetical protein